MRQEGDSRVALLAESSRRAKRGAPDGLALYCSTDSETNLWENPGELTR